MSEAGLHGWWGADRDSYGISDAEGKNPVEISAEASEEDMTSRIVTLLPRGQEPRLELREELAIFVRGLKDLKRDQEAQAGAPEKKIKKE
ncbi:hypothetical protein NCC49_001169 [Naganishia albida]|nr:hypothetical protein NCC49_001169 [Naganishia albida]